MASVRCVRDGDCLYSREHPDRMVQEKAWIGMYVLYERVGNEGHHRGISFRNGAVQWLSGVPLDQIEDRHIVPGVTLEA